MKIYFMILLLLVLTAPFISVSSFALSTTYTYDDLHRLTKVQLDDGRNFEYQYDELGNRIRKIITVAQAQTFTVTPTAGLGVTLTPNTPQTVNSSSTVTYKIFPPYSATTITGTCGGTFSMGDLGIGDQFVTSPVTADCTVIVNLKDTTAPTITSFTLPATATSLTIPVSTFTASDLVGVAAYLISESATQPLNNDLRWSADLPNQYIFSSQGVKTLYAFVKDAAGNVSTSASATTTITLTVNGSCGTNDGVILSVAPTTNLCTTGTPSTVTGNGPWNWTCNGSIGGGTTANCSATILSQTIKKLTTNLADDIQPAWSPDSSTIAFVSNRVNSADGSDLFAIQPDGQNERVLAQFTVTDTWHGRFGQPSWIGQTGDLLVMDYKFYHEVMKFSLSGSIANNSLPVGRSIYDGNSSYFTRVLFVPGGQGGGTPVTSPDGSIFAWRHAGGSTYMIRMSNGSPTASIGDTDTAGTLLLQVTGGGSILDPISFSPDGKKLAFAGCINNCQGKGSDLHIIDVASKVVTRITTSGDQGSSSNYPTWSSNNEIAYSWKQNDTAKYDLHTIKPDGTELRRLTQNSWDSVYPSWSPDGKSIAFSSNEAGNYNIYTITGFNSVPVNGTCGSSSGGAFTIAPSTNLCTAGTPSTVTGSGSSPWSWSCTGLNSGTTANCSTANPSYTVTFQSGVNGSLTGTTNQTVNSGSGTTPMTAVPATGYHFVNWTGTGGFSTSTSNPLTVTNVTAALTITATFAVDLTNGVCGGSNRGTFTTAPATNLCSTGSASTVTGTGPWSWSCIGNNGGTNANCNAAIDINGPVLTLSTLANGAITNNSTLNISGTVSDINGVAGLKINNIAVTITNGSFSYPSTLQTGTNTITAVATDSLGNITTDSRTITLDKTAPSLTVTTPADNSMTAQPLATIAGTVDVTSTVTIKVNSSSMQNASITGGDYSATVNLAAGINTINITATDLAGNTSSAVRTVTYDNSAPSLMVSNPAQDISTAQSSITISGAVIDTITSAAITITADVQTYTPAVTQSGSFSQSILLPTDKTYAVVVSATDQVGNSANVQRNIIKSTPLTQPTMSDALKVLQAVFGITPLTASEQIRYDVAPLGSNGTPVGNGVIDDADVILILRRSIGIGSW